MGSPTGASAALRRSSTFATESFCEHDCGRSRTPRTATAVSRHRSSGRGWLPTSAAFRRALRVRPTETSRARGRSRGVTAYLTRRLSTRSLAKRALPRPARLEHLMSRSRRGPGWSSPVPTQHPLPGRPKTISPRRTRREARRLEGTAFPPPSVRGSPDAAPRRANARSLPRGAFHRRTTREGRPSPQSVPRLWILAGAFSIPRDPSP